MLTFFFYLCMLWERSALALPLVAATGRDGRKVRAAQGVPLPNIGATGDSRILQKKTTATLAMRWRGKGEKAV